MVLWTVGAEKWSVLTHPRTPPRPELPCLPPRAHVCASLGQEQVSRGPMKNRPSGGLTPQTPPPPSPSLLAGEHSGHLIFSKESVQEGQPACWHQCLVSLPSDSFEMGTFI